MKKAKSLHPVAKPKPKPKAKHKGPRHPQAAPPHSTGSASHSGPIAAPPAHHAKPGKPHHAHKPKRPKRKQPVRKLASPGLLVACCSAEALAMSLRLAGGAVTDDDVLALYFATAAGVDDGASIEDTLSEALCHGHSDGLPVQSYTIAAGPLLGSDRDSNPDFQSASEWLAPGVLPASGLILGLDLPEGPHAVLATSAGWWSWGELYPPSAFSGAVIEEAWAVTW